MGIEEQSLDGIATIELGIERRAGRCCVSGREVHVRNRAGNGGGVGAAGSRGGPVAMGGDGAVAPVVVRVEAVLAGYTGPIGVACRCGGGNRENLTGGIPIKAIGKEPDT